MIMMMIIVLILMRVIKVVKIMITTMKIMRMIVIIMIMIIILLFLLLMIIFMSSIMQCSEVGCSATHVGITTNTRKTEAHQHKYNPSNIQHPLVTVHEILPSNDNYKKENILFIYQ